MACCWAMGFDARIIEPQSWVQNHNGWIDFSGSLPVQTVFSGRPGFLGGTEGSAAWRIYSNAFTQYVYSQFSAHHHGYLSTLDKLRSRVDGAYGGIAPVAVFVVPDLYMEHYTPLYNNNFKFSSAVTYDFDVAGGERHVSDPIPNEFYWTDVVAQLKNDPYYVDFITQRDLGFPSIDPQLWVDAGIESPSELDIDIALRWIWFPQLLVAGGFSRITTWCLDTFGGLLVTEFKSTLPKEDQPLAGWPIPIIFVKYSPWIASAGGDITQFTTVAQTAGPAPGVQDASIVDGFNRLLPNNEQEVVSVTINGQQIPDDFDFDDGFATDRIRSMMSFQPVQSYSAPTDIQRMQDAPTL